MNTTITYKCPNCDAGLNFDPKSQRLVCEFCGGSYSKEEVESASGASQQTGGPSPQPTAGNADPLDNPSLYSCPNCGAEVTTDDTTAATTCFYCHNPLVFAGKLEGRYRPDVIIPFSIDKEQAANDFIQWVGKKKFVPKNFFSKNNIEDIHGIYFPYWIADSFVSAELHATATKSRRYTSGEYEITETDHYQIHRGGNIAFDKTPRRALDKADSVLVDTVHPFNLGQTDKYSPTYLTGFQAEKRNVEKESYYNSFQQELGNAATFMLRSSISGYESVNVTNFRMNDMKLKWDYALLPVWSLTYRSTNGEIYYYTMNGQTGKITGKLPLDNRKLFTVFGVLSGILFAILLVFLFGGKVS